MATILRLALCISVISALSASPLSAQELQCIDCHGDKAKHVDFPDCGSCHTGTTLDSKEHLRFHDSFETNGSVRKPTDKTFAVNPGKTYSTSTGHGGLKCTECHGDAHSTPHMKLIADCAHCHASHKDIFSGPHGMHPVGEIWVMAHALQVDENGPSECIGCHGSDGRGTLLSQAFADRAFDTKFGRKHVSKGTPVGCYLCHAPTGQKAPAE